MTLPAPLTPPDCDLRDFPFMPLDVVRLRDSDLAAIPEAEVFRSAVLSWAVSWHQVPAASLPDDDAAIARLVGMGRDVKGWKKLRAAGALRGFVLCSDGRLYHPVVAEKAMTALDAKQTQRDRTEKARQARLLQRELERHKKSVTDNVTDSVGTSVVTDFPAPRDRDRDSKGKGDIPFPKGNGRDAGQLPLGEAPKAPKDDPWREVYALGRRILGNSAGGVITNLRKTFEDKPRKVLAKLQDAAEQREPLPWINAFLWKHGPPGLEGIGAMDAAS